MSITKSYDSEIFIKNFMLSNVAKNLDSFYNRLRWAGEEYLLEEFEEEYGNKLKKSSRIIDKDKMYWIGYIYRYWHYYKNENSKTIYKQAPFKRMEINYLMFHTMAPEIAIDDLIEIYRQNKNHTI